MVNGARGERTMAANITAVHQLGKAEGWRNNQAKLLQKR
jgi:hypothetical protein